MQAKVCWLMQTEFMGSGSFTTNEVISIGSYLSYLKFRLQKYLQANPLLCSRVSHSPLFLPFHMFWSETLRGKHLLPHGKEKSSIVTGVKCVCVCWSSLCILARTLKKHHVSIMQNGNWQSRFRDHIYADHSVRIHSTWQRHWKWASTSQEGTAQAVLCPSPFLIY